MRRIRVVLPRIQGPGQIRPVIPSYNPGRFNRNDDIESIQQQGHQRKTEIRIRLREMNMQFSALRAELASVKTRIETLKEEREKLLAELREQQP